MAAQFQFHCLPSLHHLFWFSFFPPEFQMVVTSPRFPSTLSNFCYIGSVADVLPTLKTVVSLQRKSPGNAPPFKCPLSSRCSPSNLNFYTFALVGWTVLLCVVRVSHWGVWTTVPPPPGGGGASVRGRCVLWDRWNGCGCSDAEASAANQRTSHLCGREGGQLGSRCSQQ